MSRLQRVATMPRQSLVAMKVALGARAQYATIIMLSVLMLTQIIGVVIFAGKAQAVGSMSYTRSITGISGIRQVAVAADGSTYVTAGAYVRKYSSAGSLLLSWGGTGVGNGQFYDAAAIAVDNVGNVYVSDMSLVRIQKFDSDGNYITQWGSMGYGNGQFILISSMSADRNNNLYVADQSAQRIQKFDSGGNYLTQWGSQGTGDGQFIAPTGVAADRYGNIYVADHRFDGSYTTAHSSRVQKFDTNGAYTGGWLVKNVGSTSGYATDSDVWGIAVNGAGEVYVADQNFKRVLKFAADGRLISERGQLAAGDELSGTTDEYGNQPMVIAADKLGGLYVVDRYNSKVHVFADTSVDLRVTTSPASYVSASELVLQLETNDLANLTNATYSIEYGPTTSYGNTASSLNESATLKSSVTLSADGWTGTIQSGDAARDSAGNIYVTTSDCRVLKFDSAGNYLLQLGDHCAGNSTTNFSWFVDTIAFDSADNVYIGQQTNSQYILKFDSAGNQLGYIDAGNDVYTDGIKSIVIDNQDRLYVGTSSNPRIMVFNTAGTLLNQWGSTGTGDGQFGASGGVVLALDSAGNVYALNNSTGDYFTGYRIQRFTPAGTYVSQWNVGSGGDFYIDNHNRVFVSGVTGGFMVYDRLGNSLNQISGTASFWYSSFMRITNPAGELELPSTTDPAKFDTYTSSRSAYINSLPCGTTYHYRGVATTGSETVYGADRTATTTACPDPVAISTTTLPSGTVDASYDETIQTNATTPAVSVTAGSLPPGLDMDAVGHITGTPTTAGTYDFTVEASDTSGDTTGSDTQDLQIVINEAYVPIAICDALVGVRIEINTPYNHAICTSDGFGYKTFEVTAGALPEGLTLDAVTGVISGTPTAALGSYDFTVTVTDLSGSDSQMYTYMLLNPPGPRENTPMITITSPSNGATFDYKHDTVTVTGTGPRNATITTYMDGYELGTTTSDGSGNWQYTVANVFPGEHSFDAKWVATGGVAFIPRFLGLTSYSITSDLSVVDVATNTSVKNISLPDHFWAMSAIRNHAGNRVYISGLHFVDDYQFSGDLVTDVLAVSPQIVTIDSTTGLIVQNQIYPPGDIQFIGAPLITADDQYAYASVFGYLGQGYEMQKIRLSDLSIVGSSAHISDLYPNANPGLTTPVQIGDKLYLPAMQSMDITGAVVPVIDVNTNSVVNTQLTTDTLWSDFVSRVTTAGGKLYYTVNNKIFEVNPDTNAITKEITISNIAENSMGLSSVVVNAANHTAYLAGGSKIYIVNLETEGIQQAEVIAAGFTMEQDSGGYVAGIGLFDNNTKLLIANLAGGSQVLDLATLEVTPDLNYPEPIGASLYMSDNFIGSIVSPSATVAFSVGTGPEDPRPPECPETDSCTEDPPTVTDATPPESKAIKAKRAKVVTPNSSLALVQRLPEPFILGFPWLLLLLALVLVGIQYYQVHTESRSTKRLQANLAKQTRLVEEQNNFVALSTHYLHTPLTIMEGEISLMVKAGTISQETATKLQATLTSLNAEAEAVLAQEEQNE